MLFFFVCALPSPKLVKHLCHSFVCWPVWWFPVSETVEIVGLPHLSPLWSGFWGNESMFEVVFFLLLCLKMVLGKNNHKKLWHGQPLKKVLWLSVMLFSKHCTSFLLFNGVLPRWFSTRKLHLSSKSSWRCVCSALHSCSLKSNSECAKQS